MDQTRPHMAIIHIQIEVHSLLDDGKCSGQTISDSTLEAHGIKPFILLNIVGHDAETCLKKLKAKLEPLYV